MTPEQIAATHVRTPEGPDDYCTGCGELWPCDAATLVAHIDTLTAAVEALPEAQTVTGAYYNCIDRAAVLAILNGETPE